MELGLAVREEEAISLLNEEIITMKKKIQLSEGQRKAEYEEFDAERKKITKQIRSLKKEIREKSATKPSKFVDIELLKKQGITEKELKPFEGKTPEEVIDIVDLQCIDLQKKIDLIQYDIGKKKARCVARLKEMALLAEESDDVAIVPINARYAASLKEMKLLAEEHDDVTIMPINGNDGKLIRLENKIHETGLHVLEMRHLERKYTKMRQSLLDDRVFFQSVLDKYEEEIAKQAKEIDHLQGVRDEAVRLRDKTRKKLAKLESQVVSQGIEREQQLQQLKKKVEEGRADLEKVERSLVPTNKQSPQQQDSAELDENGGTTEHQARESLQAKLQHLKEVTGAKDEEDIIQKLKTQKMTKERLLKLKSSIEHEKKKLELKREQLEAELEAVKFSEVKEKEQNEEEYERQEKMLQQVMDEIEEVKTKVVREKLNLSELKQEIVSLCRCLQPLSAEQLPDSDNEAYTNEPDNGYLDTLVKVTKSKFNELISRFENMGLQSAIDQPIADLYVDMEPEDIISGSTKLDGKKVDSGSEKESEKPGAEDLPDIPTREYLKRQSQLMVEAQGKRKGYSKEGLTSYK